MIEVREALDQELETAGVLTARAYEEFFDLGGPDEDLAYLARIRDVAERAARTTILVALLDGAIVGSLTLELDGRTDPRDDPLPPGSAHIRMRGVDPAARARGAGRALMRAAEERARAAGKSEMTLHTTGLMETAHGMYGSLGYQRVPDEIMPDGFVLMGYRKALSVPRP